MAYRLKSIRYKGEGYHILLQNENGPCPLLAAANVLILKKSITLPSNCVGAGVVTIEQLTNILAEKILSTNQDSEGRDFHINEVLKIFPNLQFGMDVNPKFTAGPTGVEYTMELNAFDLLRIELVHGWLLEPDAQEFEWVGDNTYNQLVNLVIEGNDASARLQQKSDGEDDCKFDELSNQATRGTIIRNFLDRSAHQLTQHGLFTLHEYVKEGNMVVFFRNNHYNTLTKHKESLYLLVTDFGYADVSDVVWEKLDVIDGDTEYVTGDFKVPPAIQYHASAVATGEQLVANNAQSQADYHLALQLSRESGKPAAAKSSASKTSASAVQSDLERAKQASLMEFQQGQHAALSTDTATFTPTMVEGFTDIRSQEERDMLLALELQRQEERQESVRRSRAQRRPKPAPAKDSCIIS